MVETTEVIEHMEVVGSDGEHVGTVDYLAIKLTRSDSDDGVHRIIPFDMVASAEDGKLVLNVTSEEATAEADELDD